MPLNGEWMACPLCDQHHSRSVEALTRHLQDKHGFDRPDARILARKTEGLGSVACPYCGDMLKSLSGLITHATRMHHVSSAEVFDRMRASKRTAELPNRPGVYALIHPVSRRMYIGQSVDMGQRVYAHRKALENWEHTNPLLMLDYLRMPEGQDYEARVLIECAEELLSYHETVLIREHGTLMSGYNLARVGSRGSASDRRSAERSARDAVIEILRQRLSHPDDE